MTQKGVGMIQDNRAYREQLKILAEENIPWKDLRGRSILVAGATGQICSCLIDCLMYRNEIFNDGIKIYALCRNLNKAKRCFKKYLEPPYNHLFVLLVHDVSAPFDSAVNFDYIIHAATSAQPADHSQKPVELVKSIVLGAINLLDYALKANPKKFLYISSSAVYGNENLARQDICEDYHGRINCAAAASAYAEGKRVAECLCGCYNNEYALNTLIARPGYVFGIDNAKENNRAEMQFVKAVMERKNIVLKSAAKQIRTYSYLFDAILGLLYVLLLGKIGESYNVANNNSAMSIRDFAKSLADITGTKLVFENPDDERNLNPELYGNGILNIKKLEALGFRQKFDIKDGQLTMLRILQPPPPRRIEKTDFSIYINWLIEAA
jgi:nucleoside-diphosphate-sugar epimerase